MKSRATVLLALTAAVAVTASIAYGQAPAPEPTMPAVPPAMEMPPMAPPVMPAEPAELDEPAATTDEEVMIIRPEGTESEILTISPDDGDENTEDLISITLDDVEMVDVVRMFTRISGANIIATPSNLLGRVTVSLTDVQWQPALESILDMHGLALLERMPGSKVYSIVPRPAGAPEPMKVKTYFLQYAKVENVEPVLKSMIVNNGKLSTYPSRNALVVRSTAANLGEIEAVVAEIDILRDQVFIEAKFMELNDEAIEDLGINWQVLEGYGVGASALAWGRNDDRAWSESRADERFAWDHRRQTDARGNSYDQYGDLVPGTTPDSPLPAQLTPAAPAGTENVAPGVHRQDSYDLGDDLVANVQDNFQRVLSDSRSAVLSAQDFQVVLSALKQMDGVSVVSNPKIIVANEEDATIHIGQTERPFVSSVTPGQQGIAPVVTYNPGDPVDIGVKLTVTPTVNTESNITVKIVPELTRFLRDAVAPNGQTYPIIAKKTITTEFCLESGRTVAIGGLTETTDRDTRKKVPLLGDLPLIGKYLFSHTHKEKTQQETIIFVTVGLALPESIAKESGLPEDSELVHKHLLKKNVNRQAFQADMEALQRAADAERAEQASKVRARLLRRQK